MSCYEHADGGYIIPTREWPKFRTDFIKRVNYFHKEVKQRATDYANEFNAQPKKQRTKSEPWSCYPPMIPARAEWPGSTSWLSTPVNDVLDFNHTTYKYTVNKKALEKHPTSKSFGIDIDCTTISLDNHTRNISIHVEDNNKSFVRFEDHPLSEILLRCLNRVNWTRGSGGYLLYRNEFHDHSASDKIWRYGPKGDRS